MNIRLLSTLACVIACLAASAYDFMVDGIAYNRVDYSSTVEVTYTGTLGYDCTSFRGWCQYQGFTFGGAPYDYDHSDAHHYVANNYSNMTDMVIPESVTYKGKTYTVVGIGSHAFSGATFDRLSLPATITYAGGGCFGEIADTVANGYRYQESVEIVSDQTHIGRLEIADIGAWCKLRYASSGWSTQSLPEALYYGEGENISCLITPTDTYHDYSWYISWCEPDEDAETGEWVERWYSDGYDEIIESVSHRELYVGSELLTELVIPEDVTEIGRSSFIGNPGLRSLALHRGITRIAGKAFSECTGLRDIYCQVGNPANITMGDDVFKLVPVDSCVLHVPKGSKRLYRQADQWNQFNIVADLPADGAQGDVNGDGTIDIDDVNVIINAMLDIVAHDDRFDLDGDGKVDVADLNLIINVLLLDE